MSRKDTRTEADRPGIRITLRLSDDDAALLELLRSPDETPGGCIRRLIRDTAEPPEHWPILVGRVCVDVIGERAVKLARICKNESTNKWHVADDAEFTDFIEHRIGTGYDTLKEAKQAAKSAGFNYEWHFIRGEIRQSKL